MHVIPIHFAFYSFKTKWMFIPLLFTKGPKNLEKQKPSYISFRNAYNSKTDMEKGFCVDELRRYIDYPCTASPKPISCAKNLTEKPPSPEPKPPLPILSPLSPDSTLQTATPLP